MRWRPNMPLKGPSSLTQVCWPRQPWLLLTTTSTPTDLRYPLCQISSIDYFLSQSCTASGVLQFDLVTNRDGSKCFVKPVKVEKDSSWKDAIASVVMQVVLIYMKRALILNFFQVFHDRKVPPNVLPLNPELVMRSKPATKPEKDVAISRHQTRMRAT